MQYQLKVRVVPIAQLLSWWIPTHLMLYWPGSYFIKQNSMLFSEMISHIVKSDAFTITFPDSLKPLNIKPTFYYKVFIDFCTAL